MASRRSPLRGYNHNIRYRDRIYHVQTEDSGLDKAHALSHLYFGGTIIGSARFEYADVAEEKGHEKGVQKRMQEQHKTLMKALRRGDYDERIVLLLGDLDGDPTKLPKKGAEKGKQAGEEDVTEKKRKVPPADAEPRPEAPAVAAATPADTLAEPHEDSLPGDGQDLVSGLAGGSLEEVALADMPAPNESSLDVLASAAEKAHFEASGARHALEPVPSVELQVGSDSFSGGLLPQTEPAAIIESTTDESNPVVEVRLEDAPPVPMDSERLPPLPVEEIHVEERSFRDSDQTQVTAPPQMSPAAQQAELAAYRQQVSVPAEAPELDVTLSMGTSAQNRRIQVEQAPELPNVVIERRREPSQADHPIVDRPRNMNIDDEATGYSVHRRAEPKSSGVFEKPLPSNVRVPTASQMLQPVTQPIEVAELRQQRGQSQEPAAPPVAAPRAAPRSQAPHGSTPQRYTAPSAAKRRRRTTGAYQTVARSVPPPRAPSRSEQPPEAATVVARPAVVVGRKERETKTQGSGGGISIAAKGPPIPRKKAAGEQEQAARARGLPSIFGSDLISERSLDEVILHYLAEDGEQKE